MKTVKKLLLVLLAVSIFASMLSVGASANGTLAYGAATVDTASLNVRSGPSMSDTVLATLNEGDIAVILERTNSEWYQINFHGVVGYVNTAYLRDVLTAENFNAIGRINGDRVNIRSKPTISGELLGTYPKQTDMTVIGINNGWYKVRHAGHTGYVRSDYMLIVSGTRASSSTGSYSVPSANLPLGQQIVDYAMGFLGSRYVYGGTSPSGFDCSGFVTYVYKNFGISVSRTAHGQYRDNGVIVNKADLSYGDLVFFSSNGGSSVTHVGIYISEDEFIHSSTSSTGVIISRLDGAYYTRVWHGAKRLI